VIDCHESRVSPINLRIVIISTSETIKNSVCTWSRRDRSILIGKTFSSLGVLHNDRQLSEKLAQAFDLVLLDKHAPNDAEAIKRILVNRMASRSMESAEIPQKSTEELMLKFNLRLEEAKHTARLVEEAKLLKEKGFSAQEAMEAILGRLAHALPLEKPQAPVAMVKTSLKRKKKSESSKFKGNAETSETTASKSSKRRKTGITKTTNL